MNKTNLGVAITGVSNEYRNILLQKNGAEFAKCITAVNKDVNKDSSKLSPAPENLFAAFKLCPWKKLRVIIIGQDPYTKPRDACGLAFSVNPGIPAPPSLVNIYKCLIEKNIIDKAPEHGDLSSWAEQGMLMLNAALTTSFGKRMAHIDYWEKYTDAIIKDIATEMKEQGRKIVFILWGGYAQKKAKLAEGHHVLMYGHPSPISPFNKVVTNMKHFMYCNSFTECNRRLLADGQEPIDWKIE